VTGEAFERFDVGVYEIVIIERQEPGMLVVLELTGKDMSLKMFIPSE
jgi:hypothetical protein